MCKKIKVGEYWSVHYKDKNRGFSGIVRIKQIIEGILQNDPTQYSCIIDYPIKEKWVNKLSGALFFEKDFIKKVTEKDFLVSRLKKLAKESSKTTQKLAKKSGIKI